MYEGLRAYPGLILEGGKIKKKFRGAKSHFFDQKYQFFSKIYLFLKKNLSIRGAAAPLCPHPGYALMKVFIIALLTSVISKNRGFSVQYSPILLVLVGILFGIFHKCCHEKCISQ